MSMVRSSYIIIVSVMGDDVPILGALVTLFGGDSSCCFWWCFFTPVRSDHHISSLYLVWEMTCQFWGLWWHFLEVMSYCCFWWYFYKWVWSDHHISSLYLLWEMTFQFFVQLRHFWGTLILSLLISFRAVTDKYILIKTNNFSHQKPKLKISLYTFM